MSKDEPEAIPDQNDFDDLDEDLGWSCNYLMVCILLPLFNGFINGYSWSGLALHYQDMGWPIERAGTACTIGFGLRLVFQQAQMRAGFWVVVPLGLFHLATAILGTIYTTQEWAVILEVATFQCLDPSITIEGIAFDVFGLSETMARQASSTVLAVFTFAVAGAVTIGGIIYDFAGWQGMSAFHAICQLIVLSQLVAQPVVRKSFWEFFKKEMVKETESNAFALSVVPAPKQNPAQDLHALQLEEVDALPGAVPDQNERDIEEGRKTGGSQLNQASKEPANTAEYQPQGSSFGHGRESKASSQRSSAMSDPDGPTGRPGRERHTRGSVRTTQTRKTGASRGTQLSGRSALTVRSAMSGRTQRTALSRLTNMKDSDNFQHHFMASNVLRPTIAQRAGPGPEEDVEDKTRSKAVPKDLRIPLTLIVICCFCNYACYVIEFSTFAIFFKAYHGWEAATWASLAQTAGDLVAAVMMKLLRSDVEEVENPSFLRRMTMQPYNIVCLLFCWILCNLGMISPLLPVAVAAQVIMGTVFVYIMKMTNDLNLFFSMGDTSLYLTLQVYCKNAEACGGCISSFLGPFLFARVNPFFPFVVSTAMSTLTFVLFTAGFCQRVGCEDIETAEAQRSRRLGTKRVSHWSVVSRKTTDVGPVVAELHES
ncbi:unnamed protein product [Durusdinium trenchii]|uniref:Uncharacterized protein n=1 Tax=Durusdinium trenchii TaxID=1381693 RepID=A0ABP0N5L9_9DINO